MSGPAVVVVGPADADFSESAHFDAVRAFLLGNIDYLAIGPYLVPHPRLTDNIKQRRRSAAR